MTDIKLFVCCHQRVKVPNHPLLYPLQVGAALANEHYDGFLHDDTGDNISKKNRSYCELTAQYWAWKNIQADYFGFFHYRRYLYPDTKAKLPYRIEKEPSKLLLDKLKYEEFPDLISKYDLIIPKGEDMHIPVREHYASAPYHWRRDLDLAEQIVCENSPEMAKDLKQYFSSTVCYFGNIYIMQCQVFWDYCGWLFPILEKFDRLANTTRYSAQEQRVDGYLAERLLGVYLMFQRNKLKILELPRIHFDASFGGQKCKRRCLYFLLPPGTKRRAAIKKLVMQRKEDD